MPAHLAFNVATQFGQLAHYRFYALSAAGTPVHVKGAWMEGAGSFAMRMVQRLENPDSACPITEIYALAETDFTLDRVLLCVELGEAGTTEILRYGADQIDAAFLASPFTLLQQWSRAIGAAGIRSMIDIGGRARSGLSRKDAYPGIAVTVADILAAPDVDIVADVHELSIHTDQTFDAFMSCATFEHLIMPWKAAVEINKVLALGAPGLILTHQTLGMHDLPWDFYRFSDTAWKGIFNTRTGFEILGAGLNDPAFILPTRWHPENAGGENARGFMTSGCVVRKISEPLVDWDATTDQVLTDMYPEASLHFEAAA